MKPFTEQNIADYFRNVLPNVDDMVAKAKNDAADPLSHGNWELHFMGQVLAIQEELNNEMREIAYAESTD